MKRGEVRWYRVATPDKRRPVVILTRDSVLAYLGEVSVAPITTTVRDIPSEVLLGPAEGMKQDCAVNCDHIQTVAKDRIGALVAVLPTGKLRELTHAIRFALDL